MKPSTAFRALPLFCFVSWTAPAQASGQLRPYEPFGWEVYDGTTRFRAMAGGSLLSGQRASLAGAEGTLSELGIFSALVRTGRVGLEASGTVRRILHDPRPYADPAGGAQAPEGGSLRDSGDYLVSTSVLLTRAGRPSIGILRFGARLPTTDNRVGLGRDQTDFYATLGGRTDRGPLRATGELGVGIHGTREAQYEQSDVLVFLFGLGLPRTPGAPTLLLVGHADGLNGWTIRGNEELAELRLRLRSEGRVWLQGQAIAGLTLFSPAWGLSVSVGTTR